MEHTERVGKPVLTGELLGNLREVAVGKPSRCPTCGAASSVLKSPGGYLYHQLRCDCQRARVAVSAKRSFDAAIATWSSAVNQISALEVLPPKERDEGIWAQAWGAAKRAAIAAREQSEAFGFILPRALNEWGRRVFGGGWG